VKFCLLEEGYMVHPLAKGHNHKLLGSHIEAKNRRETLMKHSEAIIKDANRGITCVTILEGLWNTGDKELLTIQL